MLRSGVNLVLGLVWLWCLLAAAAGAHLPVGGLQGGLTSSSSAGRIFPQIPEDPAAAFLAGQRLAAAPSSMPLYIKLLNGQHGSRQAAELQFGNNHNRDYGNYPAVQPNPYVTDPINNHGQQAPNLTPTIFASTTLAPPAVDFGSAVPMDVVTPEPSLPFPPVTHPVLGGRSPVLTAAPLSVAAETGPVSAPLAAEPEEAEVSEEPQEATIEAETFAEPPVAASSIQTPVAAGENNIHSSEGGGPYGTLSSGFFRHLPIMYRLPSFGDRQQEGHYIIIMPEHKTKAVAADGSNGKVRDVTLYLATGVRILEPHDRKALAVNLGADGHSLAGYS